MFSVEYLKFCQSVMFSLQWWLTKYVSCNTICCQWQLKIQEAVYFIGGLTAINCGCSSNSHGWQWVLFIFSSIGHSYRIVVRDMQIMGLSSRQAMQPVVCCYSHRLCGLAKGSWLSIMTWNDVVISRSYKCGCILMCMCVCVQKELSPQAALTFTGCWLYPPSLLWLTLLASLSLPVL